MSSGHSLCDMKAKLNSYQEVGPGKCNMTIHRTEKVHFHQQFSGCHASNLGAVELRNENIKQGVPQRGVLIPTLFNIYINKIPKTPYAIYIYLTNYADDCTIVIPGPSRCLI